MNLSVLPLTSLLLPSPLPSFLPFILHREVSYGCDRGQIVWNPLSKAETPHAVSPYTSLFHRWERASAVWFSVSQWATFLPGSQYSLICELMLRCSLGSLRHLSSLFLSLLTHPQPGRSHLRTTAAREDGNTSLVGGVLFVSLNMTPAHCERGNSYWRHVYLFCRCWRERDANKLILKKLQQLCIWILMRNGMFTK